MKLLAKVAVLAGVALVMVVVVVHYRDRLFKQEKETTVADASSAGQSPSSATPLPVTAAPARRGDMVLRISATGLTRPRREIIVTAKVGGEIVELPATEGKSVQRGQLLLRLDDREYQLALAEAMDRLLDAQAEYNTRLHADRLAADDQGEVPGRESKLEGLSLVDSSYLAAARLKLEDSQRKLHEGKISEVEYQKAKLSFETARVLAGEKREQRIAHKSGLSKALIDAQRAKLNLSYTEIRAPFSGLVGDVKVMMGQYISPGQECFRLLDLSQADVDLGVLESEIGLAKEGCRAEVAFVTFPGEVFTGEVISINPLVDPDTKTCRVRVRLANPEGKLKAGMYAFAKLEAQIFRDRFIVPKEAVLVRDNRKLLFIVRDGLAKWCYVDTGLEDEHSVEILGSAFDLKEGELVITSGHYTLAHDTPVRVVE